jgi:two-component system response regulator YesN
MYNVIVVDDYEFYRKEIRSMPVWGEKSGFTIIDEAANGRDAHFKLQQKHTDLLITDIRMPLINGLELLKKVMDEKLCPCVILMSQFSDFEYARQGLTSGAFDYLLKPVDSDELLKVLERAAAQISEKQNQMAKISYLDEILNKSGEKYFPEQELENLINLVIEGNPAAALEASSYLVDMTFTELGYDSVRTALVLNKTLKKLVDAAQSEYSWLDKFTNLSDLKMCDFSQFPDIVKMKGAFTEKIGTLLSTVRKYELGIDNSSMVRNICRTILENIDSDLSVNALAARLFITRTYLSQIFKEKTGTTLISYIIDVKIDRAKALIMRGVKVSDIPEILGYKDEEYFRKLFKKMTGCTINEFKNQSL